MGEKENLLNPLSLLVLLLLLLLIAELLLRAAKPLLTLPAPSVLIGEPKVKLTPEPDPKTGACFSVDVNIELLAGDDVDCERENAPGLELDSPNAGLAAGFAAAAVFAAAVDDDDRPNGVGAFADTGGYDDEEEDDDENDDEVVVLLIAFLAPPLLPLSPPNGVGAFNEIGGYADDDEDDADADADANDVFVLSDSSCLVFVDEDVGSGLITDDNDDDVTESELLEKLNLIGSVCCFDAKFMPLNGFVAFSSFLLANCLSEDSTFGVVAVAAAVVVEDTS